MKKPVPIVSVVIPTYNHGDFIAEAIRSVLNQTHGDHELVVVDDGSTDNTSDVVNAIDDPRVRYIKQENRGATAARNTGMRASSGKYIALLDADDIWHPDKLLAHVEYLEKNPAVGVSYNAHYVLNHSSDTIRTLWRPPNNVTLSDLVLGFPFGPSDTVLRRRWAFDVDLFDEQYVFYGDDLDFFGRLALAGCRFGRVDRVLNYRRHHSGRVIKNLPSCLKAALLPLHTTFGDARCPGEVLALRDRAFANHLMFWTNRALNQGETNLGQELLRDVVRLDPTIVEGKPSRLLRTLIASSVADDSRDHETLLRKTFNQLPEELSWLQGSYEWAVARGYLSKGTRDIEWNRLEQGEVHLLKASKLGAEFDESFLKGFLKQLADHEALLGPHSAQQAINNLALCLEEAGYQDAGRRIQGGYWLNQAFSSYRAQDYSVVPGQVATAAANDPRYLANRGVLAILARSVGNSVRQIWDGPDLKTSDIIQKMYRK